VHDYHFIAWSAFRLRFHRRRPRSGLSPFPSRATGNAAARSHARPRRIGPEKTARSGRAGTESDPGGKKEILPDVKPEIPRPRLKQTCSPTAARQRPPWRPRRKKYKLAASAIPTAFLDPILTAVRLRSRKQARSICPPAPAMATARAARTRKGSRRQHWFWQRRRHWQ